jgi:copper transport protein
MTLRRAPAPTGAGRRTFVAIAFAFLIVVLSAPQAGAHAVLIHTKPGFDRIVKESPDHVTLHFSEPVEIALGAIRVYDSEGHRVDRGSVRHVEGDYGVAVDLDPALARGTYTTTWSVVSADSHPVRGAFVWHVGAPGPHPQGIADDVLRSGAFEGSLFAVARWMIFAGLLLLVGCAVFALFMWRGPGRSMAVLPAEVEASFHRRWRRLLAIAWWATAVGTLAGIVLEGATAAGIGVADALSPDIVREVLDTRYGQAALMRLALLVVAAVVWFAWQRPARARATSRARSASLGAAAVESVPPTWLVATGITLMLLLLATPGLSGHAATADPEALNIVADTAHLAAGAVWIGALGALLFLAFPATAKMDPVDRARTLGPIVTRFSDTAVVAVTVLVVSGTYRAWIEVGSWSRLTGTNYGLLLITKIAVFLPLLALGAINNRVFKPRIAAAADSGDSGDAGDGALWTLRRVVMAEVSLAIIVIAVTAVLVNVAPARPQSTSSGPFVTDVSLGENNLNVLVQPARVGANQIHLTATAPSGAPVRIKKMTVLFEQPARDIGPLEARARQLAPGHFVVQGRQLSVTGEWTIDVAALVGKFKQIQATVQLMVRR